MSRAVICHVRSGLARTQREVSIGAKQQLNLNKADLQPLYDMTARD